MPSLGADMDHGKMVEWLVKPGDFVHRGDVVAVVDTEKTVMDVETFEEGVVAELLVDVGTTVPVGTPLARITPTPDDGAAAGPPAAGPAPAETAASVPPAVPPPVPSVVPPLVPPPVRHLAHRLGIDADTIRGTGRNGAVTRSDVEHAAAAAAKGTSASKLEEVASAKADEAPPPKVLAAAPPTGAGGQASRTRSSPRARRLAAESGLDLATVTGTGPGGAVTEADVLLAGKPAAPVAPAPPKEPAKLEQPAGSEARPSDAREREATLRRAVGALMSRSKKTIPHYYLSTTLDMAASVAWMQSVNLQRPVSSRLVVSALLLKAAALAAKDVPEVNGFYVDDEFRPSQSVHLGVAVALRKGGIVAPAIHDADTLPVDDLMDRLRDLVARARGGKLQRAEMADPTLTVTNLGDLGVESVFGVIYPPQVAMVGLGRLREEPWAHDGMLGIRAVVTATLSADHRVSDGLRGARYLARLEELLQKPEEL
jgi:pyruvate dehydrogenase E2 component (dihydrolipoamide acetyltransferase)